MHAEDEDRITIAVQVGEGQDDTATVEIYGYSDGATAVIALVKCGTEEVVSSVAQILISRGQTTEEEIVRKFEQAGAPGELND